jgi:hypothetical protein
VEVLGKKNFLFIGHKQENAARGDLHIAGQLSAAWHQSF